MGDWKFGLLLILVGDVQKPSKTAIVLIFKFRNSKFELKDHFVNN